MAIYLATGIFSGLDTGRIIDQLMALEKRPIERLQQTKQLQEVRISAYGSISGTLSALSGTLSLIKKDSIAPAVATSSDTAVLTASLTPLAKEASYSIRVDNIASNQNIHSSSVFPSEADSVADLSVNAVQKFKIQAGAGPAVDITIDSSNNTLAGLRDAINNASAGVVASTINDGTGFRLVLSAAQTGAQNRIIIQVDENNDGIFGGTNETDLVGLSQFAFNPTYDANGLVTGGITNMTQTAEGVARDASFVIDGLAVSRSSNTVDDLITGVTINLHSDSAGGTVLLNIASDTASIIGNINSFVSAYNMSMNIMTGLTIPADGAGKVLTGSSASRKIMSDLQASIITSYAGNIPAALGLGHDSLGVLSLDASMLENALRNDRQGVINTFDAMAASFETMLNNHINILLTARTDGLNSSVEMIDASIMRMSEGLARTETNLRRQFTSLEMILAELQQTGDFITRQFNSLEMFMRHGR